MDLQAMWMWVGFLLAAYSVVGNDSIQTLGTFIASNRSVRWYYLWAFAAVILVATILYSYILGNGDIASGRLSKIPFVDIQWYHAVAPLGLVLLTHVGIPVSTSLLVLSAFASSLVFEQILIKSTLGYGLAAIVAYTLWVVIYRWDNKQRPVSKEYEPRWRILQWSATGFLWFTWLSHDLANVAVFLPRQLDIPTLITALAIFVAGLGYIFWQRGGKIQKIVLEKSHTNYLRSATIIDLCYALILLVFKEMNSIPMSTTWVFIGLLSGRELAISTMTTNYTFKDVFPLVGKDVLKLLFGLGVSVLIALFVQNMDRIAAIFGL